MKIKFNYKAISEIDVDCGCLAKNCRRLIEERTYNSLNLT